MRSALIGYTGFVGGNLQRQHSFTDFYNSKNIDSIRGQQFDLVVCAGVQAKKWLANKEPDWDWQGIQQLMAQLDTIQAKRFVLISTIDVYPSPLHVDEATPIDLAACHPYGKHRLQLEQWVAQRFEQHYILRLPALFGQGLRKNVIYDFLNNNNLHQIHQDGVFQFYDLKYLWADIQKAITHNIRLLNLSTEPVSVAEIAEQIFNNGFTNNMPVPGPRYDYYSQHAALWGGQNYQYSKQQVLADMKEFVDNYQPEPQSA